MQHFEISDRSCPITPIIPIQPINIDELMQRLTNLPANHQGFASILRQCRSLPDSWMNVYFIHPSLPKSVGAYRDEVGQFVHLSDEVSAGGSAVEMIVDGSDAVVTVSNPGISHFERRVHVCAWVRSGESCVQRNVAFERRDCLGIESYEAVIRSARRYGGIIAIASRDGYD